ncbi:MAG: sulfite exporter TauE/SafE family protein [Bacillati bacterium ANGP1]|uniref:Probable membrane transporter protein n=1 Tax=Candidatus Segetimicrobium genomatis TaxID=2569760 RepID=A0A537JNL0_9BACT|nr:MAG: sulfite exporter TauE/SafE family protein [Terrabacteria group bacterium ANGP1]
MTEELSVLVLITLAAAVVNGALGHGFSSITVPVALLFYTSRILNPALVLLEVCINTAIVLMSRSSLPGVGKRVVPIVLGLVPGIVLGSLLLPRINAEWLKLFVYALLLPLILLQAGGIRKPVRLTPTVGAPFGTSLGILYSLTTISGPPLALLFNGQGLAKRDFRAAIGLIRVAESTLTAIAYYHLGLYTAPSLQVLAWIAPSVAVGLPIGALLIQRLDAEVFRRLCMSFDAWIVGFGLSKVLVTLGLVLSPWAYLVWTLVVILDLALLTAFFGGRRLAPSLSPIQE